MNEITPRTPGLTRLRDYGALQADVSTLVTREMAAIQASESDHDAQRSIIQIHACSTDIAITPVTPGETLALPGMKRRFGGVIKVIPFHTASARAMSNRALKVYPEQAKPSKQATTKKRRLTLALRLGLTLLMCALLARSISWPTLLGALWHIQYGMIGVSLVVGAAGIVLSAYQWSSLLRGEGICQDLADLVNLYFVGIAFSHFLPTGMGGDAVKAFYVGRESGNRAGSASAVVLCRVTGFVGMLFVAVPSLLIWHRHFTQPLVTMFILLSLLVGSMISGTLLVVGLLPWLFKGRWAKKSIFVKASQVGHALQAAVKRPRSMSSALAFGLMFWVVAILNCYAYGDALRIDIPSSFYLVVVPLISLVSFLPISINGYGLRESAYVFAFSTVRVAPATALLLALLLDAQALLFGLVGGCVYFTLSESAKKARMGRAA